MTRFYVNAIKLVLIFFITLLHLGCGGNYRVINKPPFTKDFTSGRITHLDDGTTVEYSELGKLIVRSGYVVIDDATYFLMDSSQQLRVLPGLYTVYELWDEYGNIAGIDIIRDGNSIRRSGAYWITQVDLKEGNRGNYGYWDGFSTQRVAICDQFYLYDIRRLITRMDDEYDEFGWRYWHYEDYPRKIAKEMGVTINDGPSDVLISNVSVLDGEIFLEKNDGENPDRMLFINIFGDESD